MDDGEWIIYRNVSTLGDAMNSHGNSRYSVALWGYSIILTGQLDDPLGSFTLTYVL